MKDSLVRHWAQRAQMALDAIDKHSAPRRPVDAAALEAAVEEVRTILCRLAGAATKDSELESPEVECEDCYEDFGSVSCLRLTHKRRKPLNRGLRT